MLELAILRYVAKRKVRTLKIVFFLDTAATLTSFPSYSLKGLVTLKLMEAKEMAEMNLNHIGWY